MENVKRLELHLYEEVLAHPQNGIAAYVRKIADEPGCRAVHRSISGTGVRTITGNIRGHVEQAGEDVLDTRQFKDLGVHLG